MMKDRRNSGASSSLSASASGRVTPTAARALLLLPLGLAFFALLLQVRDDVES